MSNPRKWLALLVVFLVGAGTATALQFPKRLFDGGLESITYRVTDGVTTAADGTAQYLGPYDSMVVVPQAGIDANNTYDVNCGFSGDKSTTPSVFDEVLATTNTMDVYAMPDAQPCEWIRVDKVADDGTATTIDVHIVRAAR